MLVLYCTPFFIPPPLMPTKMKLRYCGPLSTPFGAVAAHSCTDSTGICYAALSPAPLFGVNRFVSGYL